jgi:hypothetical protein
MKLSKQFYILHFARQTTGIPLLYLIMWYALNMSENSSRPIYEKPYLILGYLRKYLGRYVFQLYNAIFIFEIFSAKPLDFGNFLSDGNFVHDFLISERYWLKSTCRFFLQLVGIKKLTKQPISTNRWRKAWRIRITSQK